MVDNFNFSFVANEPGVCRGRIVLQISKITLEKIKSKVFLEQSPLFGRKKKYLYVVNSEMYESFTKEVCVTGLFKAATKKVGVLHPLAVYTVH